MCCCEAVGELAPGEVTRSVGDSSQGFVEVVWGVTGVLQDALQRGDVFTSALRASGNGFDYGMVWRKGSQPDSSMLTGLVQEVHGEETGVSI